jgi:hypothetical protein
MSEQPLPISPAGMGEIMAMFPDYDEHKIDWSGGQYWLKLGIWKNTHDSAGFWTIDSGHNAKQVPHWDYIEEKCVAHGEDEAALLKSARDYKRLTGMNMIEFFEEKLGRKFEPLQLKITQDIYELTKHIHT